MRSFVLALASGVVLACSGLGADAGEYSVIVGNIAGSITSAPALLAVLPPSRPPGALDLSYLPTVIPPVAVVKIARQPDDKIILATFLYANGNAPDFLNLHRLNRDGTVDASFHYDGDVLGPITGMAVQADGRILAAGYFNRVNGQPRPFVARLHSDGTLDPAFAPSVDGPVWALALQADGRLVMGGGFTTVNGQPRLRLARLNPDGSLDESFDPGAGVDGEEAYVNAILVQANGDLVIAGQFESVDGVPRPGIARVYGDPPPPSFVRRQFVGQQVGLLATPPTGISVYAVEDQPPPDWHVQNISDGGAVDPITGKVKFGPFYDAMPRALRYEVLPPPGAHGGFTFTGQAAADGVITLVAGDQVFTISGRHPADVSGADWQLTIGEVTAYGAAWRRGSNWAVAPHPIPIDYVTRAAFLWRGGECYAFAAGTHPPLCWVLCAAAGSADFQSAVSQVFSLPDASDSMEPVGIGERVADCKSAIQQTASLRYGDTPVAVVARQLPSVFVPGESLIVRLEVIPPVTAQAYALAESIPRGWTVADISDGGEFDPVNGAVKWGPYSDAVPRDVSYRVRAPDAAEGVVEFAGVASFDGASVAVGGADQSAAGVRLLTLTRLDDQRFRAGVRGVVGNRVQLEASSELVEWERLGEMPIVDGWIEFADPAGGAAFQRFYRIRPVP